MTEPGARVSAAPDPPVGDLAESPDTPTWRTAAARQLAGWVAAFGAFALLIGALCGLFWWGVVDLPTYTMKDDFTAVTTERGLTQVFGTDAWFTGIGLIVGLALGYVAWRWFHTTGWPVAVIAGAAALAAGLACWRVGELLGPGAFDVRLAAAEPGQVVPIQFQLTSPSALAAWVFAAVLPTLLWASLAADAEEPPRPQRRRWQRLEPRIRRRTEPIVNETEVVGTDLDVLRTTPEPPRT